MSKLEDMYKQDASDVFLKIKDHKISFEDFYQWYQEGFFEGYTCGVPREFTRPDLYE